LAKAELAHSRVSGCGTERRLLRKRDSTMVLGVRMVYRQAGPQS
jgi:hypothetical protein